MRKIGLLPAIIVSLSSGSALSATIYSQTVEFATDGRSMWGPSSANRASGSQFLGASWRNEGQTVGGIGGSLSTTSVVNPAFIAWQGCREITPSPFRDEVCGSTAPAARITTTTDTRTGLQATLRSSGDAGVLVDYAFDGGSVDANLGFQPTLKFDPVVEAGTPLTLSASAPLTAGAIATQSPTFKIDLSSALDLNVTANGQVCFFGAGCSAGGGTVVSGGETRKLVSIDKDQVEFFPGQIPGGTLSVPAAQMDVSLVIGLNGLPSATVNGFTVGGAVGPSFELGSGQIGVPVVATTGQLQDGKIVSSGMDQILALNLDLDTIGPVPPGGTSVGFGPFGVSLDGYDVKAGPRVSFFQQFEVTGDLMVDLLFDREVLVDGELKTEVTSRWDALPELSLLGTTVFTPDFWVDASLSSGFGLQYGLGLDVEFAKGAVNAGPFSADFGPLRSIALPFSPDFLKQHVLDITFGLGGFDAVRGQSFTIAVLGDHMAGGSGDGTSVAPIPLPPSAVLLAGALGLLSLARRRGPRRPGVG